MKNKISGIYCIKNIVNGKIYIGRSVNIYFRFWEHKNDLKYNKDSCSYLQNAWNKYGSSSFLFFVLEECKPESLNKREKHYIKLLQCNVKEKGYNLTSGGKGLYGYHHSDDTKKKISESNKGKKHTEESKALISKNRIYLRGLDNPLFGKKLKKETIEKLSISRTGKSNYGWGKKVKGATSIYIGVHFDNYSKKWVSRARVNKKLKYIGKYKDELSAAIFYNEYIKKNNLENTLNLV